MPIRAFAATAAGQPFESFEYEPDPLAHDEVEINVEYCGICHSDLSMLNNDWEITTYPFVPGHEVVGTIGAVGDKVTHLQAGQRVGLGWTARSCLTCDLCVNGDHNLCQSVPDGMGTIVGRHGGFAERVRCQAIWAFPLPEGVDPQSAGPLFCGGITVFNPLLRCNIKPTMHVGVVGIGGLGHMAIGFADKWGCEVTAFSTSPAKEGEARQMGADHFINSKDAAALEAAASSFDMIIVTVNVPLDWDAYVQALKPTGRLHIVGAVQKYESNWMPLIGGEKSLGGSPTGGPWAMRRMLDFAGRHRIAPMVEEFPMTQVNEAMEKLRSGKPRYRIVLKNDLG